MPSGLLVCREPSTIMTILGSCVAMCVWDMKLRYGGVNHFMLPFWNGNGLASPKFGNIAIEMLLEKMFSNRSEKKNLVVKLFGGAKMLQEQSNIFNIGEKNIQVAYEMLKKEDIVVVAASTGGMKGRKIYFNTQTGEVLQKYLCGAEETVKTK